MSALAKSVLYATGCENNMPKDALALINSQEQKIKELTEENERLFARNLDLSEKGEQVVIAYKKLSEENERLRADGKWIDRWKGKFANPTYECSICQKPALGRAKLSVLMSVEHVQHLSPFCPHCGAKMKGERYEEQKMSES
jgi:hypothetical protein